MLLYPRLYLESVKQITIQMLEQNNIKGLILDVDNTLIDFGKNMPEGIKEWANNMKENGIKLLVDIENGQKTGYFLDQKMNRRALVDYVKNKNVLDCFSHTGGFLLHALKYDASFVTAVDISEKACEDIDKNAKLNGFTNYQVVCADVFDFLRNPENADKYDCIILDPPAFTKSKDTVKKAYKGYKEINLQALNIIKKGGILFTFSCSMNMTKELFLEMIKEASHDSKRVVRLLDFRFQSIDHPMLLTTEETVYLKCAVLYVE